MIKQITIINKIERLRRIIRAEGTPAIQARWDELEPHVSFFLNAEREHGAAGKDGQDGHRSGDVGRS
jgi:hypothetical protein